MKWHTATIHKHINKRAKKKTIGRKEYLIVMINLIFYLYILYNLFKMYKLPKYYINNYIILIK